MVRGWWFTCAVTGSPSYMLAQKLKLLQEKCLVATNSVAQMARNCQNDVVLRCFAPKTTSFCTQNDIVLSVSSRSSYVFSDYQPLLLLKRDLKTYNREVFGHLEGQREAVRQWCPYYLCWMT